MKGFDNVTWDIYIPFVVDPVDSVTTIMVAFPIDRYLVVLAKGKYKVIGLVYSKVFDSEVVNKEIGLGGVILV